MALHLHTALCEQLGIHYPIVQAGMAGGPTTAALVAAVSEAGGLGTLGAAYMEPKAIRETIREIRRLTNRPFAVNLFAVSMEDDLSRIDEVQRMLHSLREQLGISQGALHFSTPDPFSEQFQILLEEQVPVISTAFGVLNDEAMRLAKQEKRTVIAMVTSVNEALMAEEQGADILVAQGSDAGGHRGTFSLENYAYGVNVGTFSLVPQVVDAVQVPVIAAGGIMDGRGLLRLLPLVHKQCSWERAFWQQSNLELIRLISRPSLKARKKAPL
nr:nitronate monooxygenase [Paenibacillus larvae]